MLIIDRFEGGFAVIETSAGIINVPIADVPTGAKEGDVLTIQVDSQTFAQRKKSIDKKMNELFND